GAGAVRRDVRPAAAGGVGPLVPAPGRGRGRGVSGAACGGGCARPPAERRGAHAGHQQGERRPHGGRGAARQGPPPAARHLPAPPAPPLPARRVGPA
ncbi:Protein of unknown function, partial [Gryllus bimaculatus]